VANYRSQRETLKSVASALKQAAIPFALAGGYAVWARGGPESAHDVDFVVKPEDAKSAQATLTQNGLDDHFASEDWLFKVCRDDVVVDVIHRLPMGPVDDELLGRCDTLSVDSVAMPVMDATDLVIARMKAFSVQSCDFAPVLGFARTLREQVDWSRVRSTTGDDPFGRAFLLLLESLEVIDASPVR
jgi:hypothetical protein